MAAQLTTLSFCPFCFERPEMFGLSSQKISTRGELLRRVSRIALGKIVLAIYLWSLRELLTTASGMKSLSKNTVGNIYALLRYYCTRDLQDRPVIPFGGNVYVVKCDENQFKHKSKVRSNISNMRCSVSSGDETLCRMFDISSQTKSFLKEKLRMQILSSVSSDFQTLIKH